MNLKLTFNNVTRSYKTKIAIDKLTCELTPGVYGLIGLNGAGKTTLLRMLADVLKPTSGEILLNGVRITLLNDRYRDLLGYLPQECGFYSYFTVHRFMLYMSSLKGIHKHQMGPKIDQLLKLVNLKEHQHKKIGKLSGGMKRRLGIAQALLNDPKILILDEPTAGLDPQERVRFRNLLSDISGDRIIILSTHIITDIEYIAREVLLLKDGKLVKQERPEYILKELENMVWTIYIPTSELPEISSKYIVGNLQRNDLEIEARIISSQKPPYHAEQQVPRLEDIYLYYFGGSPNLEGGI